MTRSRLVLLMAPAVILVGCANSPEKGGTLASLRHVAPDTAEMQVDDGILKATQSYRRFLDETPESSLTPDAMRRLADLEIEKQFGILGDGKPISMAAPPTTAKIADDGKPISMPAPSATAKIADRTKRRARPETLDAEPSVSERELEQHVRDQQISASAETPALTLPDGAEANLEQAESAEAIKIYDELLAKYPS